MLLGDHTEGGSMKTRGRAAVERTHVTAEIQRYPGHYRVVSGQIKLLYVRWGEKHQGCLHRFAWVDGHIGGDDETNPGSGGGADPGQSRA